MTNGPNNEHLFKKGKKFMFICTQNFNLQYTYLFQNLYNNLAKLAFFRLSQLKMLLSTNFYVITVPVQDISILHLSWQYVRVVRKYFGLRSPFRREISHLYNNFYLSFSIGPQLNDIFQDGTCL